MLGNVKTVKKIELEMVAIGTEKELNKIKEQLTERLGSYNLDSDELQIFFKFAEISDQVFDLEKRQEKPLK